MPKIGSRVWFLMLKSEVHAEPKGRIAEQHRRTASPSMDTDLFMLEMLVLQALNAE